MSVFAALLIGFALGIVAAVVIMRLTASTPLSEEPPPELPRSCDDLFPDVDAALAAQAAFLRELYQSYTRTNHTKKGS